MKVSKHVHSCLFIEDSGKTILVDPGNYTAKAKALNIATITQLDFLVITHEHPDHMDIPTIKNLVTKFPSVKIFSNASVKDILGNERIEVSITDNEYIHMTPIAHEKIWMGNPVPNVMATLFGRLSTPGDSFSFQNSAEILALPLQGPWGSMNQAVETALHVKPKVIIPIHDYHLKDEFLQQYYKRLNHFFAQHGIDFKEVKTGEVMEI